MKTHTRRQIENTHEAVRFEHESWLTLVAQLKRTGAVTEADCASSPSKPITVDSTPGENLFEKIRVWGENKATLEEELIEYGPEMDKHHAVLDAAREFFAKPSTSTRRKMREALGLFGTHVEESGQVKRVSS